MKFLKGYKGSFIYTQKRYGINQNIFYLFKLRKTGAEVFGNKIWWNNLRPIHATLYLLFSYLAINKNNNSWYVLLLDVIIGIIAFSIHHKLI